MCNAENERQLRALASSIAEDAKKEAGIYARGYEGEPEGGWVLVDFGDVVVHIFAPNNAIIIGWKSCGMMPIPCCGWIKSGYGA
jgi:hypothetical protein